MPERTPNPTEKLCEHADTPPGNHDEQPPPKAPAPGPPVGHANEHEPLHRQEYTKANAGIGPADPGKHYNGRLTREP